MQSLFSVMSPDSEIVRKKILPKGKCKHVINNGPAPYCEKLLIQNVTTSPCHSYLMHQLGQMDI